MSTTSTTQIHRLAADEAATMARYYEARAREITERLLDDPEGLAIISDALRAYADDVSRRVRRADERRERATAQGRRPVEHGMTTEIREQHRTIVTTSLVSDVSDLATRASLAEWNREQAASHEAAADEGEVIA